VETAGGAELCPALCRHLPLSGKLFLRQWQEILRLLPSCEAARRGISSNLYVTAARAFASREHARGVRLSSECGFAVGSHGVKSLALAVLRS